VTFEAARFDLARLRLAGGEALDDAMARAAKVSAVTLGVRRVGVWTFDREHDAMRCLYLYDALFGHSTPGSALTLSRFEPYAHALEHARLVIADDAHQHPATRCLRDAYLVPNGVGAMLDAPIYRDGEVVGVVCHEHLGGARHWTTHEIDFACSVADMLGSLAEQATRLEMAAALRGRQKMEALGRLAGGVAHDFQNVLSVVLIHAARIEAHPEDAALALEAAREISDAAEQGVLLTKRLQSFASPQRTTPQRVSIGEVLSRLEPMLRLLTRGTARLTVQRETLADEVFADPAQLEEVLFGLVTNVRDALVGDHGAIMVTVRAVHPEETLPGALCVALEVRDESVHSDAEAAAHFAEPLLKSTIREAAGVGLSAVRNIVHRARGTVRVAAPPGGGATFTVMWPLAS
jgi:signal transduction histidine kinase